MIDGRLRVGVQLPEVERDVRWAELRAIARTAEASGYDSIWVGDHMLYRGDARPERGPWDAWSMLAALAASTERVQLGPLVASTAFHPPGLVARMAAAIDEVSAGRFTFGVGTGWNEAEFRAFGIAFEYRGLKDVAARSTFLVDRGCTVRVAWRYDTGEVPDFDEPLAAAQALSP